MMTGVFYLCASFLLLYLHIRVPCGSIGQLVAVVDTEIRGVVGPLRFVK